MVRFASPVARLRDTAPQGGTEGTAERNAFRTSLAAAETLTTPDGSLSETLPLSQGEELPTSGSAAAPRRIRSGKELVYVEIPFARAEFIGVSLN